MSFTVRNTQSATTAGGSTLTITKPTGLTVGDLMTAVIGKDDDPALDTVPSGWSTRGTNGTTTGNDVRSGLYSKIADAADVAASNFVWGGDANEDYAGVITAFIPSNSNPVFVGISTVYFGENEATPASNALSTAAGSLIIGGCVAARNNDPGIGVVDTGTYTVADNPYTGTGNGDVGACLAYDLSGAGGSLSIEFDTVNIGGESHAWMMEFSDDAADTEFLMGFYASMVGGV